jgi:hypothetical protein
MGGLFLDIFIVYVFRMLRRLASLLRSRRWGKEIAAVSDSHLNDSLYNSVNVEYEYAANGQEYVGSFEKPFILDSSAKAYAEQFARGMEFKIRFKPGDPSVSVADSTVENWWWNH